MSDVQLTIDGMAVTVPEGTTVFDAARMQGIPIPTLCHQQNETPVGVCRVCVVDVGGRHRWGLQHPQGAECFNFVGGERRAVVVLTERRDHLDRIAESLRHDLPVGAFMPQTPSSVSTPRDVCHTRRDQCATRQRS